MEAGALGDGTTTHGSVPVLVSGGLAFASVGAGLFHSNGMTTAGLAYSWGLNEYGVLGNGTATNSLVPVPVSGGLTFVSVNGSHYHHVCGVTMVGNGYCWGSSIWGQLGTGVLNDGYSRVPVGVIAPWR